MAPTPTESSKKVGEEVRGWTCTQELLNKYLTTTSKHSSSSLKSMPTAAYVFPTRLTSYTSALLINACVCVGGGGGGALFHLHFANREIEI